MRLQRRVHLPRERRARRGGMPLGTETVADIQGSRPAGTRGSRSRWRTVGLIAAGMVAGAIVASTALPAYRALAQSYPQISTVPVTASQEQVGSPAVAVYQKLQPSIVLVTNQSTVQSYYGTQSQLAWGSGVIFDPSGYIVTNDHVVRGATKITVTLSDGSTYTAHLVGGDASTDLAVIKINAPKPLPAATFANSADVVPGELAIAIGNPLGPQFSQSVTQGIVSAMRPMLYGLDPNAQRVTEMIQTDAPINPGNSGGALANAQGEVIGIVSMKVAQSGGSQSIAAAGLGFAIPSNTVRGVVNQLVRYGQVKRAWLGIGVTQNPQDVLPTQAQTLTVSQVYSPGPSAGKLQDGDVIVAWQGQKVLNYYQLVNDINNTTPGQTVRLTVRRGNATVTESIQLGTEPAAEAAQNQAQTVPQGGGSSPWPFPFPCPNG